MRRPGLAISNSTASLSSTKTGTVKVEIKWVGKFGKRGVVCFVTVSDRAYLG